MRVEGAVATTMIPLGLYCTPLSSSVAKKIRRSAFLRLAPMKDAMMHFFAFTMN
jgi:hypothetical protein